MADRVAGVLSRGRDDAELGVSSGFGLLVLARGVAVPSFPSVMTNYQRSLRHEGKGKAFLEWKF